MRVGFDATSLTMRRAGIGRYTLELLRAVVAHEPAVAVRLMAHRALADDVRRDGLVSLPRLRGPGSPLAEAWMQAILPVALAASDVELCHFTNYHAPLICPVPMVVSLHDMSLVLLPDRHPRRRVATMGPLLGAVGRRAAAVLCLSAAGRRDAIEVLGLDPDRVHVVSPAPAPSFARVDDPDELARVAARHRLRPGFLLFVGTVEPRKNLVRLVDAFARLRADGFAEPLVVCGGLGWKHADLFRRVAQLGLEADVRFLGYVPDPDLPALLTLAGAFAYPSLYEGFGLPVVEALACGTPTVTSDRPAAAEIAAGAALLVDPEDVDALAAALAKALTDGPTRERLRVAGPRRAASFSWERAAHETAAVYRSVAEARA